MNIPASFVTTVTNDEHFVIGETDYAATSELQHFFTLDS